MTLVLAVRYQSRRHQCWQQLMLDGKVTHLCDVWSLGLALVGFNYCTFLFVIVASKSLT